MVSYDILNDKELLAIRDAHLLRANAVVRGEACLPVFRMCNTGIAMSGDGTVDGVDIMVEPELWMRSVLNELVRMVGDAYDETTLRLLIVDCITPLFSSRFMDKIYGAEVWYEAIGQTWVAGGLTTPVGTLEYPDIDDHPAYQALERAVRAFAEAEVRLPYIMPPALGSPLNTAVNLYGSRFLEEVYDCPDSAHHDLRILADVQTDLARRIRGMVPPNQLIDFTPIIPCFNHFAGCTTQLVSADMYRDVFMPYDEEVCANFTNGGIVHLCGSSIHHIPSFRAMEHLRGVEVTNYNHRWEDFEQYYSGLRDDQIIILNAAGMGDDAEVLDRIERLTGGRRIVAIGGSALENPPLSAEIRRAMSSGKPLVDIRDGWMFRTDANAEGERQQWFLDRPDSRWRPISIDRSWTEQGYNHRGIAWYTATVPVPRVDEAHRVYLVFHAVDGCATVWINGVRVGEQLDPPELMWNRGWGLDVTDHVKADAEVQVTVRVTKDVNLAGIWRPVELRGCKPDVGGY